MLLLWKALKSLNDDAGLPRRMKEVVETVVGLVKYSCVCSSGLALRGSVKSLGDPSNRWKKTDERVFSFANLNFLAAK